METILLQFVDTLDASLKKIQEKVGDGTGVSKLTINQFHYIDAIYELGTPTITAIAGRLKITKASVTAGVHKLIRMGFVSKTQSNEDRRVYHVSLTTAGEALVKAKYEALKEYGEFIRAALDEEEIRQFQAILSKLVILFTHTTNNIEYRDSLGISVEEDICGVRFGAERQNEPHNYDPPRQLPESL